MDEQRARDVVLVQAIERADRAREIWGDADRIAAGEAAARAVGDGASPDAFVAGRADIALSRLGGRVPALRLLRRARPGNALVPGVAAAVAFIVGIAAVHIGPAQRINLLAPPVLALLAWNIGVYALLAVAAVASGTPRSGDRHALRDAVIRLSGVLPHGWRDAAQPGPLAVAATTFASEWTRLAAPLWQRRATGVLHAAAAALALGEIAGLYLRGIALEYRAVWQSTFLNAGDVARILHVVLAPGAWLTGIPVPTAGSLALLGPASLGENAAHWIHLYAGTILLVVVVPRLLLAVLAWTGAWRLARQFPLPLDAGYFQRLLRGYAAGTASVFVIPYSLAPTGEDVAGLGALLARTFEAPIALRWSDTVHYGDDAPAPLPESSACIVLFSMTATPEAENHGALVRAIALQLPAVPVIAIVDTTEFTARFRDSPRRISEREAAWRQVLEPCGTTPVFAALAHPDLASVAEALNERLERHLR